MGCCCLPPDRVKLAVNSKKETNSRVKMGKGSKSASVREVSFFTGRGVFGNFSSFVNF